ncbi:MAG: hypothetical protein QNJ22_09455 [Desulfosarcinaceae bacterium]|nr:hypothetical protein [Desulfosarcinaceae bacterium]
MRTTIYTRFQTCFTIILFVGLLFLCPSNAGAEGAQLSGKATGTATEGGSNGLQRRIDFGNSYILGQSIKSGAVYLLHRKKSEIKSMLHYRENYREEILESFSVDEDQIRENSGASFSEEGLMTPHKKTVKK